MTRFLTAFVLFASAILARGQAPAAPDTGRTLVSTYSAWRTAMVRKDVAAWQNWTAPSRQLELRNRILSEKRPYPGWVFEVPAPPPALDGLKMIHLSVKGPTAKAAFYGKINFGVGGNPTENILVVSFVNSDGWKYDRADFVNLAALPEVRGEIAAGNMKYVNETPDFQATGSAPLTPRPVNPAKYIAQVYVFCPGREVKVNVNNTSQHRFANAKEAEIVIGGALDGLNSVNYTVRKLEGGTGKEAMTIRVYLMSEIQGTKPIKAFEYQVQEGGVAQASGKGTFTLDPATAAKLLPPAGR
ncbi:hypothetical protein [Haloferula sp. BvORR071]|uniref:hypothetical protein n=1 Tax=Haloferula sp. BvORR071 TaxID=1396141 RepID=UPI000551DA04|nr:hypothetical protein [Haloferula sp. BvORR071]